ncbi:Xylanolytic transcriptional activator xlnR [Hondaea fermentalgiana]|uniref:Xylanolytic transcriptional activator xlnR n=1 Tax=Hondaea fermentalgiana TaxID=2315210 RepID=A0A2R5G846_9STRA|nr:Xylanolytic transcriptional activator xlnR [Hondaea fermentalgiana]|eukprot:GBG27160.1 Xylanolytic transcriptional activator xlnR [Hondaea fermentalgiana]
MEFRSDLRLTLKSSCDACTGSKVKCSGEDPCSRCVRKGIQCFYSPKKKRGPVKKRERAALVANQPMVVSTNLSGNKQMSSLGSHERRSWSVFFTLYKHYAVSCSLFWFNRQLHKMRQYLIKKNKVDALKRLSAWMDALNIDVDELAGKVEACHIKIRQWGKEGQAKADAIADVNTPINFDNEGTARHLNHGNPFHLRVKGHRTSPSSESGDSTEIVDVDMPPGSNAVQQTALLGGFSEHEAHLRFKVDYMAPGAESKVTVTRQFEQLMGYGGEEIERNLRDSGGGFLPWGGDVLSRILVTEADLLSFVQVTAIKFNTLGKPEAYPICREVPSVHLFKINWKDSKQNGPVDCIVKCVHREFISDEESSLSVFMSFSPMGGPMAAPAPSLPIDSRFTVIEDEVALPPKRFKQAEPNPNDAEAASMHAGSDRRSDASAAPRPHVKYELPPSEKSPVIYDYIGAKGEIDNLGERSNESPADQEHQEHRSHQSQHQPQRYDSQGLQHSFGDYRGQDSQQPQQHQDYHHQQQHQQHYSGQQDHHQHYQGPVQDHHHHHEADELGLAGIAEHVPIEHEAWPSKQYSADGTDALFSPKETLSSDSTISAHNELEAGEDMLNLDLPLVDSSDEESLELEDDGQWLEELLKWTGPAVNRDSEPPAAPSVGAGATAEART